MKAYYHERNIVLDLNILIIRNININFGFVSPALKKLQFYFQLCVFYMYFR